VLGVPLLFALEAENLHDAGLPRNEDEDRLAELPVEQERATLRFAHAH